MCRSKYHFIKLKYWKSPNKTFARNSGQLSYLHIHMICSYTIWAIVSYTTFFFCGGSCLFLLDFVRPNKSRDWRFIFEYISTICTNESLNRKWESFYVTFSNMFVNYFPELSFDEWFKTNLFGSWTYWFNFFQKYCFFFFFKWMRHTVFCMHTFQMEIHDLLE